jgi:superfamily II RNA helicase
MVKNCALIYPSENEEKYKHYYEPFTHALHDFQKWSIESTVTGNHTLVCAPTGTGKSLCAEFAIDFFHSMKKKSIYCSPIKSLSNQKFYDFTHKYPHISVGLITGDIKTNPAGDVLIMTTEILLNKLYQLKSGSPRISTTTSFDMDIENELGCVIFDEIHMIGDKDRGHVWENSIMMLPPQIQIIGLSATLDNPEKFAQWIESCSKKEVFLAKKMDRPVPLTHYSFITVNSGIFKSVKDKAVHEEIRKMIDKPFVIHSAKGVFNEDQYNSNVKLLKLLAHHEIRVTRRHVINQVSKYLVENEMTPALCYVFSRKQLEICAKELTTPLLEFDSKVSYTIQHDCEQILRKLPNFQEYLFLPEYVELVGLLQKGVGIHHAGMLPILREIVEILFSKGCIKMLFCTTSVAIGLNLPVKTCIFTDICKHDGQRISILQGHEYVQAAGRSGRLGIDTVGNVIHLNNLFRDVDYASYKKMLKGAPQVITSNFKISYNLLMNLIDIGATQFTDFAAKSMIRDDLDDEIREIDRQISEKETALNKIMDVLKCARTPIAISEEYIDLIKTRATVVNKKRKEVDKRIQSILDEYKFVEQDKNQVDKIASIKSELACLNSRRDNVTSYLSNNVQTVIDLLIESGFVKTQYEDETISQYKLTPRGVIASNLRECHCLVMSEYIETGAFIKMSAKQIVAVLSCFTNVTVPDEQTEHFPKCSEQISFDMITSILNGYDIYMKKEQMLHINSGIDYTIHYNLVEYVMKWCDCECVEDCKLLIQTLEQEKGIFLGEFVKALLKINNISCEMEYIAEKMGNIEFLHILKQIPTLTMKYVVTNQSLYV